MKLVRLLLLAGFVIACTPAQADPDAGHIRFGRSVDMTTSTLSGEGTTFSTGNDVAFRAAMPEAMGETTIRLVGTLNGTQIMNSTNPVAESEWTVYVGTIPGAMLFEPGRFEMKIVDIGNNELASGSFTVR